jgi:hypothetical protein
MTIAVTAKGERKMRDRLIELVEKAQNEWLQKEYEQETHKYLAEYVADRLLTEEIIVLPCKVGQTVYIPAIWCKEVLQYRVGEINLGAGNNNVVVLDLYIRNFVVPRSQAVYFNEFGKTVFLTLEEAEKALAERSEE